MSSEKDQQSPVVDPGKTPEELSIEIPTAADETQYPPLREVVLVSIALYLAVFLVALVRLSIFLCLAF